MFTWVTHDDRLLGRLPPPAVIRAARLRFMVESVAYSTAFAQAFVRPLLALAVRGVTALYYPFDQASVPAGQTPRRTPQPRSRLTSNTSQLRSALHLRSCMDT